MSDDEKIEVGTPGFWRSLNPQREWQPAVVSKVGRKWFRVTVEGWDTEQRFSLDSGYADGGQYTSPGRFVTAEQRAAEDELRDARVYLRECGFTTSTFSNRASDEDVVAVAAFLRERKGASE